MADMTLGGTISRLPSDSAFPSFFHLFREVDFSVSANSVSNAAVVPVLPIPAGAFVMGAYVNAITNETSTALLGDGANTGGYLGTFCDLNVTITYVSGSGNTVLSTTVTTTRGAYARNGGKYYPVADNIDLIPTNTLNTAKVSVGAWGFMMNKPPTEA
jgi:hypothetical protein